MKPYHTYDTTDLASSAANRNLDVQSRDESMVDPTKDDYIQSLEEADRSYTFRFLDLSAEIRTKIYEELLVLQDSFTCYPQILLTCRSVHGEASNILYGDNLIEAKVYHDGVYVHGEKCATILTDFWGRQNSREYHHRDFKWPHFLRKLQFLKLSVVSYQMQVAEAASIGPICSIINSLCDFLHKTNRLRSIEVDLQTLSAQFYFDGKAQELQESLKAILYPMRYLSTIRKICVKGVQVEIQELLTPSPFIASVAREIVSGSRLPLLEITRLAHTTCEMINNDYDDIESGIVTHYRYENTVPTELPFADVFD